jgi:hypothetical protein
LIGHILVLVTKELTISFVVVALIILLIAAFGMGRKFQNNGVYTDTSRGVSITTRQMGSAPPAASGKTAAAPAAVNPTNDMLKILSPKKGNLLCLKNTFDVVWQVPEDMAAVTIKIAEAANGDTIHDIGSFPADYQGSAGKGTYKWIVGENKDKVVIEPGAAYHILIQGTYNGWFLSSASEYFTISDCE